MHFILLAVGVFLAIVGIVLIRYGVPLDEYGNSPLLVSGMIALAGGAVTCGLFVVARTLSRIAERLEIQPMAMPPIGEGARAGVELRTPVVPSIVRAEPLVPPVVAVEAPAAAEPRVEPVIEPAPPPPAAPVVRTEITTPQPRVETVPPPPKGTLFGWLSGKSRTTVIVERKMAEPAQAGEEASADLKQPPPPPVSPAPQVAAPGPASNAAPPVPPPVPAGAAVYKSGVIDGMAYTLYTDGSIEAQLPQGPIRFSSVEALQSYLVGR